MNLLYPVVSSCILFAPFSTDLGAAHPSWIQLLLLSLFGTTKVLDSRLQPGDLQIQLLKVSPLDGHESTVI